MVIYCLILQLSSGSDSSLLVADNFFFVRIEFEVYRRLSSEKGLVIASAFTFAN